jgi:hypothetical protein
MAETNAVTFEFTEVVEALIKRQGIHEGQWGIYFEFGFTAGNGGAGPSELRPFTMMSIQKVGIQRVTEPTNLSVDAAIVNPVQATEKKPVSPKKRSTLARMD